MRLEGKVVLVTGAASGMGRVACERFAREGANLIATDIRSEGLAELAAAVERTGVGIVVQDGDVANEADVQDVVRLGMSRFGRIDGLYNNAGIFPDEDESALTLDEGVWGRVLDVNLKGVALYCKHVIPGMINAGGGSIVNASSFVTLVGCTVPQDAYTASKGGVSALTRSLAVQFGPHGVRVNAVCPGPVLTPLLQNLFADPVKAERRLARIPLKRFGQPEDVVNATLFLLSDEASWITGTCLSVDGGITINYF